MRLLGIPGSLRAQSINRALLGACAELLPPDTALTVHPLNDIPLYNEDLRSQAVPDAVTVLAQAIADADAVVIATPEYNYSIPGVLKNAIDWVSRLDPQPFDDKPVSIVGASPGRLGTARAQYHLRQVFVFLNARVLNKPEVMVGGAGDLFEDGRLVDERTRGFLERHLEALQAHARRGSA